jgi:hypothetical protein
MKVLLEINEEMANFKLIIYYDSINCKTKVCYEVDIYFRLYQKKKNKSTFLILLCLFLLSVFFLFHHFFV